MIETCAPTRSWENTSEPNSVVPSGWSALIPFSTCRLEALGSSGAIRLPKIAISTNSADHSETQAATPGVQEEVADAALGRRRAGRGGDGCVGGDDVGHLGHFDCTLGSR